MGTREDSALASSRCFRGWGKQTIHQKLRKQQLIPCGLGGRQQGVLDKGVFPLGLRVRVVFQAAEREDIPGRMQTTWRSGQGVRC